MSAGEGPRGAVSAQVPEFRGTTRGMSMAAAVHDELRARILRGQTEAGSWLRAEAVADELGVSRTPVREAFRQLHADGLIELIPNRGARVLRISDTDLDSMYDLRAVLEGFGARRAAMDAETDVDALRKLCSDMEFQLGRGDDEAFSEIARLNAEFHDHIHRASGDSILPGVLSSIVPVLIVRHSFRDFTRPDIDRSFAQHRELADAIDAGDGAWAESVMCAHVLATRASFRRRRDAEAADTGAADTTAQEA